MAHKSGKPGYKSSPAHKKRIAKKAKRKRK